MRMYKSLQGLRAIAAILVVLYHIGGALSAEKYFALHILSVPFSFGSAGVEFFFVLSGFIIFTAHKNDFFQPHMILSYFRKRFVRIYPTYWIIFLLVFVGAIASGTYIPYDSLILLKSLLLIPQDINKVGGTGAPVIIVAWTLQYEMFFYLFFATLLFSGWLAILAGIAILFIYLNYTIHSSFPFNFLTQAYPLLFIMGMGIGKVHASRIGIKYPISYAVAGGIMFLTFALDTILSSDSFIEWHSIYIGVSASFILFGLVLMEDNGQIFFKHRWMQLLGDSSYVLYLIHYPMISLLCKFLILIHINKLEIWGAMISYCIIFFACLISAMTFHLWIEKPIINCLREPRLCKV